MSGPEIGENLVVNGSFEDVTYSHGGGHFLSFLKRFFGRSAELVGWQTSDGPGPDVRHGNPWLPSADGRRYIELDGSGARDTNSAIHQDIPTEGVGTFQISFQYSPPPYSRASSNGIEVIWNGEVIDTVTADGGRSVNWQTFTYEVEGAGDVTRLEFRAVGADDGRGGYLDDLSVVRLPDPPLFTDGDDTVTLAVDDSDYGSGEAYDALGGDDHVTGGDLDDDIFGNTGDDTLIGGDGDDRLVGGAEGEVLVDRDVTIEHDLSGLDETPQLGVDPAHFTLAKDHPVSVTFVGEEAGFHNTIGVYKIADDGTISDVEIVFRDASITRFWGGTKPGTSVDLDLSAGDSFGVFLIANGAYKNYEAFRKSGHFEFRDADGSLATIDSDEPELVFIDSRGRERDVRGDVFHSAAGDDNLQLNGDDAVHVKSSLSPAGNLRIAFEDLPIGTGSWYRPSSDEDFNDVVLDVTFAPVVETVQEVASDNDVLIGGDGKDELIGGFGDDTLDGGDGKDTLSGGVGDDVLDGGKGRDTLSGDDGDDTLDGGGGKDTLLGGAGDDTLDGGGGADVLFGDVGDDRLFGRGGADELDGGAGRDKLFGNGGDDKLWGRGGKDVLKGGNGDDVLRGGGNDDTLKGGNGDDTLIGGAGSDTIDGGAGDDKVKLDFGDAGGETADGGLGFDRLDITVETDDLADPAVVDDLVQLSSFVLANADENSDSGPTASFAALGLEVSNFEAVKLTIIDSETGEEVDGFLTPAFAVSADPVAGDEDTPITLGIGAAVTNAPDLFDVSVTITGVPAGATLSAGTDNGGGSYTLAGADLAGLTLTPPVDASDDIDLGISVSATSLITGLVTEGPVVSQAVTVDAVADAASLTVGEISLVDSAAGDDNLVGTDGKDTLQGFGGNDTIDGAGGADTLIGDGQPASLSAGLAIAAALTDVDGSETLSVIIDGIPAGVTFSAGADNGPGSIALTQAELAGLTITVSSGVADFSLNVTARTTDTDVDDGSQSTADTVATVSAVVPVSIDGDDIIIGGAGKDTIEGNGGNDTINGDGGADTIDAGDGDDIVTAGGGADVVIGGAGNDTIDGNGGNDDIDGGDGDDVINGGSGDDIIAGGLGNDDINGGGGFDTIDGGDGDDIITGGNDSDTLIGGLGNDELIGSAGEDTLDGGDGDDLLKGGDENDTLNGGSGNDTLNGGSGDNVLDGGDGDDVLDANEGADRLTGGGGNDTLDGGGGDDTLDGGEGDDNIQGRAGNDTVLAGLGADTVAGGAGDDVIDGGDGDDNLMGDAGADTILGGLGADVIDGGNGVDTVYGGDGDDQIFGGGSSDTLDGGAGADVLFGGAGGDVAIGGAGDDTIHGDDGNDDLQGGAGEDIIFGGAGKDLIFGGDDRDELYGDDDDDTIFGGHQDDQIFGGAGDDVLTGDGGNDRILAGDGNDIVRGGDEDDTLRGELGNDTLFGDAGRDILIGAEGKDTLYGGTGNDLLFGQEGADELFGGDGNDELIGGGGGDLLDGGAGNDRLQGDGGSDIIRGGEGVDFMMGNGGSDRFVFDLSVQESGIGAGNRDFIQDFEADNTSNKHDTIEFTGVTSFDFVGDETQAFTGGGAASGRFNSASRVLEIDADGDQQVDQEVDLGSVNVAELDSSDFTVG